jgi:hypothetical protein
VANLWEPKEEVGMSRRGVLNALLASMLATTLVAAPTLAQSPSPGADGSPSPGAEGSPSAPAAPTIPPGPTIFVAGVEYAYTGLPTSVPVGASLSFVNRGSEVHELAIARRNDDTTESWEELLQLPEEEALSKVTLVGALVALPGQSARGSLVTPQEGDYLAVCFIPQGTTSLPPQGAPGETGAPAPSPEPAATGAPGESPAAAGPPHFVLGMQQQFTVTAPGSSPGPVPTAASTSPAPAESPAAASPASTEAASPGASPAP